MSWAIRYLDSDPYGRAGHITAPFATREDAEEIARAIPNAAHVEVIEVPPT